MQAVLINGSCNEEGNTRQMLDSVEAHLKEGGVEAELVQASALLSDLNPPYCTACSEVCAGTCYAGTAVESFFRRVARTDIVIAGSPVYFGTVSAPLKGLWDLTRALRSDRSLVFTVGAALSVGGGRFGGQETTVRAIHDMMLIQGMIILGDSDHESIGHQGVCATAPAGADASAEARLGVLARGVIDVARATRALRRGRYRG